MKRNRFFFLAALLVAGGLALPGKSFAQPTPPPPPVDTPLDGGLAFLLAAGAAYGIKKVKDGRMKKHTVTEEE